jgi:hypothetical protein
MKTQSILELSDVQTIAAAAQAEAEKNNWAVSIAIVDACGRPFAAFPTLGWRTAHFLSHCASQGQNLCHGSP